MSMLSSFSNDLYRVMGLHDLTCFVSLAETIHTLQADHVLQWQDLAPPQE